MSAGWEDPIRSVAIITVQGNGICTGQPINNCSNDGTPYFLTANHCSAVVSAAGCSASTGKARTARPPRTVPPDKRCRVPSCW